MDKDQKLQALESIQAELWEIQNELNSASEIEDLKEDITAIWEALDIIMEEMPLDDSLACYTISITDQAPTLGANGVWTVQRIITKTQVDCIGNETGQRIASYSLNSVFSLTEYTNRNSNPANFSQISDANDYTFQDIVTFFGLGSLTWKTVRDMKFQAGEASKTIQVAWGGNSNESTFAYIIQDSGVPTLQQNGFITTRTIQKIDMSPGKAPNDNIQLLGNVYAQDLTVDEIIRLKNTANPTFNTISTPRSYTRAEILGLFEQQSATWQKFLELEEKPGAGTVSFSVLWEFSPGEADKNLKLFFADRQAAIQKTSGNIDPFDDFEGMKLYYMMLIEFQEKFLPLASDNNLYREYVSFYSNTVIPEITRVENLINATPQDSRIPTIQNLELDPNLQGKKFIITTGLTNGQTIYGRLDYIADIPNSTEVSIQYVRDFPDLQDDELTVQYNTEQSHEIEQGYAQALLNDASRKIQNRNPNFFPASSGNPLPTFDQYPPAGQIMLSGNGTTLYIASNLAVDCYNLQIQDGPLIPITAGPNNMVVGYTATRTITRVRRNCSQTAIVIIPNAYMTGLANPSIGGATFSGNLPQNAGTPTNLARGVDFAAANAYFLANPNNTNFNVPNLVWYLPGVTLAGPPNVNNVPIAPISPLPIPFVIDRPVYNNPGAAVATINAALAGLPPNGNIVVNAPQPPATWVDSIGNNFNVQTNIQQTTNTVLTIGVQINTPAPINTPVLVTLMTNRFILVQGDIVATPGLNLAPSNVINNGVNWGQPTPSVNINATAVQTVTTSSITIITPPAGWVRP